MRPISPSRRAWPTLPPPWIALKQGSFHRGPSGQPTVGGAGIRACAARNIAWRTMRQPTLFDRPEMDETPRPPDQAARDFAVDPANDVVLEASAGTGKTRVLVDRYVRLVTEGVEPRNILAITFTRKAAAEMRSRVLEELSQRAAMGAIAADRWRVLNERIADIQISTIDAFCFSLLREFPLEAGVD